MKTFQKQQEPC